MRILKLNKFTMVKKEVEEFVQQKKNLGSENRLDHSVEILQGSNYVSIYCFIFLK